MIPANRFVIQSRHRDDWLAARETGVTATMVAKAATPSGFAQLVASWDEPPFQGNIYTDFGNWAERYILEHAHSVEGILPNDWLIRGEVPWQMGTPDGLSLDHELIAEAKTGADIPKSVCREHRDQCIWNLGVTGAKRCLYLFQPRAVTPDGDYYMGLFEPWTQWIDFDADRFGELVAVGERLMEARNARIQP